MHFCHIRKSKRCLMSFHKFFVHRKCRNSPIEMHARDFHSFENEAKETETALNFRFGNPQSKYIVCTSTITAALKYFIRAVGTFRSLETGPHHFFLDSLTPQTGDTPRLNFLRPKFKFKFKSQSQINIWDVDIKA